MYQHTIYCDTMSEKPTQEVYLVCKQRLPCCLSVSPPYADVGRISARCWIENQVQNIPEQKPTLSKVEIVKCANSFDNFSIPSHFTPSRRLVIACLSYSIHYVLSKISCSWTRYWNLPIERSFAPRVIEAAVEYSVWFVSNLIRATRYWGSISSYSVRL